MSCKAFTCYVETDANGFVTHNSAAIVRKFTGQSIHNLVRWMNKIGGFRWHEYKKE